MPSPKIGPPIAPSVLENVPKAVIRALDVKNIFMDSIGALNPPTNIALIIAFSSIEDYLYAAKRQQRRIERARVAIGKDVLSRKHVRWNLFNEIHFYMICWARIVKLGRFIAKKTRFRRTSLVLRRYHAELEERNDCRNHLEHFEERLPGSANQNKLLVPNDLLNMTGNYVTYGGRRLDVGPASIRLLVTIVAELRTAIFFDAVENLEKVDHNHLSSQIQRAECNIRIAKVTRALRKIW